MLGRDLLVLDPMRCLLEVVWGEVTIKTLRRVGHVSVVFSVSRVKWSVTFNIEGHILFSIYLHLFSPVLTTSILLKPSIFHFFLQANTESSWRIFYSSK